MYSLKELFFLCVVARLDRYKKKRPPEKKNVKHQEKETLSWVIGHVCQKAPKILKGLLLPLVSPITRTGLKYILPEV